MESDKQDTLLKKKIEAGIYTEVENPNCRGRYYQSIESNTESIEIKNLSISDGIIKVHNNLCKIEERIFGQARDAHPDKVIINLTIAKNSISLLKEKINKSNNRISLLNQQNFRSLLDEFKKLVEIYEKILISQNQKLYFEGFATRLDGYVNVAKLQKAVENCGSIYTMITFTKNVQGVDYESMLQALYQNFDPDEIQDKIENSKSEDVDILKHRLYDYYFLENYLNDIIEKRKDLMQN